LQNNTTANSENEDDDIGSSNKQVAAGKKFCYKLGVFAQDHSTGQILHYKPIDICENAFLKAFMVSRYQLRKLRLQVFQVSLLVLDSIIIILGCREDFTRR
jgi:hypothetical protein